ncbi:MAG: serine/threonine protein kinase [Planctomycetes bacterium]|nr:serine/threonine protein kinase [Planctomycetota bacterium]
MDSTLSRRDQALVAPAGYELERLVGRGANGRVYLARAQGDRPVAVKILEPLSVESRRRFAREAELGRQLRHPALVETYDSVLLEEGAFLVLEYVPGRPLSEAIAGGAIGVLGTLGLIRDVGGALAYLHGVQVVHRDVTPRNILQTKLGTRLCDLGLARPLNVTTLLTDAGSLVGTLEYLGPELVRGEDAQPASDVYALGASAYHALAGRPPFLFESLVSLANSISFNAPPDLRRTCPSAPPKLTELIQSMLEKDPTDRPSALEAVTLARGINPEV